MQDEQTIETDSNQDDRQEKRSTADEAEMGEMETAARRSMYRGPLAAWTPDEPWFGRVLGAVFDQPRWPYYDYD